MCRFNWDVAFIVSHEEAYPQSDVTLLKCNPFSTDLNLKCTLEVPSTLPPYFFSIEWFWVPLGTDSLSHDCKITEITKCDDTVGSQKFAMEFLPSKLGNHTYHTLNLTVSSVDEYDVGCYWCQGKNVKSTQYLDITNNRFCLERPSVYKGLPTCGKQPSFPFSSPVIAAPQTTATNTVKNMEPTPTTVPGKEEPYSMAAWLYTSIAMCAVLSVTACVMVVITANLSRKRLVIQRLPFPQQQLCNNTVPGEDNGNQLEL